MPLTSTDSCPYCGATVVLTKHLSPFVCPTCRCEFRHNFRKWLVGIPSTLVVAIVLWRILPIPPIIIALFVPVITGLVTARIPAYTITAAGQQVTFADRLVTPHSSKESRWFLLMLGLLIAGILVILVCSIFGYI